MKGVGSKDVSLGLTRNYVNFACLSKKIVWMIISPEEMNGVDAVLGVESYISYLYGLNCKGRGSIWVKLTSLFQFIRHPLNLPYRKNIVGKNFRWQIISSLFPTKQNQENQVI